MLFFFPPCSLAWALQLQYKLATLASRHHVTWFLDSALSHHPSLSPSFSLVWLFHLPSRFLGGIFSIRLLIKASKVILPSGMRVPPFSSPTVGKAQCDRTDEPQHPREVWGQKIRGGWLCLSELQLSSPESQREQKTTTEPHEYQWNGWASAPALLHSGHSLGGRDLHVVWKGVGLGARKKQQW